jgi:predicted ATPase/class 3 adenylate cyclase
MDMVVWLRSLGLAKYEAIFRDNDIDETVLPSLTHENLKELGVASFGHRVKLLDAIAALRNNASVQTPPVAAHPARPSAATLIPVPVAEAVGERRHVTVMFCDLVGSTSISAALDAEDWRDLVGAYLDAASAAVAEMGGHVAKKLGDGLMALFGYPVAQENDAERAARAALSIQRALGELNRKNAESGKPALNARVGIEIGPVVIDAAGEVYGDAPNIAARVQALAEPGTVVVTAQVQRQVVGLFVAEERGSHELKGLTQPVTLFRLVRASGGGRRAGQRKLTPLVGRDEEIAMLMRRWERARQGDGQLMLIVGEPGLGKSRLLEEFHRRLRDTPHTWLEWSCSQLLQNTPLHPIAEWGRQRFGGIDTPAQQRLAELENSLAQVRLDPVENVPLLAPLLDIPLPPERRPILAPKELRRRQLAALTNWTTAGGRPQPAVLVLEDLHWADPTTLDVLRGIAERGARVPLFVLLTARPEFRPSWGARSHHGAISLVPLDRYQVQHMVEELAARHALPKEVIEGVTERTGGVPLFVEEVTRLLLERGQQGDIQAIPPTLRQSLMARLDRLGPAREVAQIGSAIGRDFSYTLLRAVAGMDDTPLQAGLDQLSDADILLVRGIPPQADYRFKHALIQDAAYENLLKSRRQMLHRRVAEILRDRFADVAAAQPEVLAHHFTQAGLTDAAIEWWGRAGKGAIERSANLEAIAHLTKGLEVLKTQPETSARDQQELMLQTTIGVPLIAVKGMAAPEVEWAYERSRQLCLQVGDAPRLFPALVGLWWFYEVKPDLRAAYELAQQLLTLSQRADDSGQLIQAHRAMGHTLFWRGEFASARAHLEQAIALYDPQEHRSLALTYGEQAGVPTRGFAAHTLWYLGYPDQAFEAMHKALAIATELNHSWTVVMINVFAAWLRAYRREFHLVRQPAETALKLASEQQLAFFVGHATVLEAWARVRQGEDKQAIADIRSGIAAYRATGAELESPYWFALLAEAFATIGAVDEGFAALTEALNLVAKTGVLFCHAELFRLKGELFLKRNEPNQAEASFHEAINVASVQHAKLLELRASVSLARLWRDQGKVSEARDLLAPMYGWFTEGFDTRDLKEAKALLEELIS